MVVPGFEEVFTGTAPDELACLYAVHKLYEAAVQAKGAKG
jgi:hypothetical protein